jgi:hypothetical protein
MFMAPRILPFASCLRALAQAALSGFFFGLEPVRPDRPIDNGSKNLVVNQIVLNKTIGES